MDENINRALVLGSQIFAVVAVVTGAVFQKSQLRSARPPGPATQVNFPDEAGDRYARLWEDPLRSLESFVPKSEAGSEAVPIDAAQAKRFTADAEYDPTAQSAFIRGRLRPEQFELQRKPGPQNLTPQQGPDLILWHVLEGYPTPEARERRTRTRYATNTALASLGYRPTHGPQLDSISLSVTPAGSAPLTAKLFSIGYLEAFENHTDQQLSHPRVFVAWHPDTPGFIGEERLFPIETPAKAREALAQAEGLEIRPDPDARTVILHHGNSNRLITFIDERYGHKDDPDPKERDEEICFVRATVDPGIVAETAVKLGTPSETRPPPDPASLTVAARRHTVMTPDSLTMRALARELRLRIFAGREPDDRLVVFTESDTAYGRDLERLVREEFEDELKVEVYSYLRGLDGLRDGRPTDTQADSGTLTGSRGSVERPWGTNQYDYLRRLARTLFEGPEKSGPVVAVGVLGSDPFDKLLVLQALQKEVPDAIYFTTDLDSFFSHQNHLPFTRNLLIGAGDGLLCGRPAKEHSRSWEIPPMRDSYQTALVRTVRQTVMGKKTFQLDKPDPRIWEVGVGKFVELPDTTPQPGPAGEAEAVPASFTETFARRIAPFLAGLGFAILLLAAILCREDVGGSSHTRLTPRARFVVYSFSTLSGVATLVLIATCSVSILPRKDTVFFACLAGMGVVLLPWLRLALRNARPGADPDPHNRLKRVEARLFAAGLALTAIFLTTFWLGGFGRPGTDDFNPVPFLMLAGLALATSAGSVILHFVWKASPSGQATEPIHGRVARNVLALAFLTLLGTAGGIREVATGGTGLLSSAWFETAADDSTAGFLLGEPLDPVSGVSIWPSVILRGLAFFIGVLLLMFTSKIFFEEGGRGVRLLRKLGIRTANPVQRDITTAMLDSSEGVADKLRPLVTRITLPLFGGPLPTSLSGRDPSKIEEQQVLADYLDHFLNPYRKWIRVTLAAITYFALSAVLFRIWPPNVPVRGEPAFWVERISLAFGVGLYIVHLVFCLELHLCALGAIQWLRRAIEQQPDLADARTLRRALQIAGRLTQVVGLTLLYPLSILSLLLLSRLRIFDDWTMTPSLVITLLIGAALLIGVALGLIGGSWRLREEVAKLLEERTEPVTSFPNAPAGWRGGPPTGEALKQIQNEIERIRNQRIGAFAPWFRQPIFAALLGALVVFGGVGAADSLVTLWIR